MKKILILGAGLMSRPLVNYLVDVENFELLMASRTVSKAEAMVKGRTNAKAVALNVADNDGLEKLIKEHDISISLLPAKEQVKVAKLCLKNKKHMATASYISPELAALNADVKSAGLTFINECGVDPGLDHMSAMRVKHEAERNGGKIVSFRSYCGGLPAPEADTNPIGYKFSWAPKGVLAEAGNKAKYLKNGKIIEVPGEELFRSPELVEVQGAGTFEGCPNKDSLSYIEMYGFNNVKTMFRGTLRNIGHCEAWYHWVKLGLFSQKPRSDLNGLTYRRFMQGFVDGAGNIPLALATRLNLPENAKAITNLEWMGLFEDIKIPIQEGGNIDIMAQRMTEKCFYKEGERDMLVMQHEFIIEYPDKTEKVYSSMVDFGIPGGDSSMARTLSFPVAIATKMVLEGKIKNSGILAPLDPAIYNPILDECKGLGIEFKERVE